MPTTPKPAAILVIYQKGFKFSYKKYYLGYGENYIGSHPSCIANLDESPEVASRACKIMITPELTTIQAVQPHSLYIPSNMSKKNFLVEADRATKYVIEMEKDFSICGRKAIMQVSQLKELLQVRGVHNASKFDLKEQEDDDSLHTQKMDEKQGANNHSASFEPTLLVNENEYEATLPIQNTFDYEATLRMDDDEQQFEATLLMDEPSLPVRKQPTSQPKNEARESIKIQNKGASQESVFSMPETIREDEMPGTIQEGEMPATIRESQEVFPPTIRENSGSRIQQIKDKIQRNITKSIPICNQRENGQKNMMHKSEGRFSSSYPQWKEKEEDRNIEDFDDLFGGQSKIFSSTHKINSLKSSSIARSLPEPEESQSKHQKSSKGLEKKEEFSQIQEQSQKQEQSQSILKNCLIIGHKLTAQEKKKLREKGYQQIDEKDSQDFDLLLIDEVKTSTIILYALIDGKEIEHYSWLSNPKAKLVGKIEGFPWESVYKRRGKKDGVFRKETIYYLQEELRDQFEDVMVKAGAELTTNINKNRAKTEINLILDAKSRGGKELYEEKKNYKKWSFYGKKMILESILMGEEIKEKYRLDSYSF